MSWVSSSRLRSSTGRRVCCPASRHTTRRSLTSSCAAFALVTRFRAQRAKIPHQSWHRTRRPPTRPTVYCTLWQTRRAMRVVSCWCTCFRTACCVRRTYHCLRRGQRPTRSPRSLRRPCGRRSPQQRSSEQVNCKVDKTPDHVCLTW
eukprot:Mycagemm_TRINITY_DN10108_c0_g1::TRINITY_DN10108_c0_g1_i2::g.5242::m.5242 type:complete len:147 gc:universal TRINITY_DN10108_c0_g1_i2:492-932(+)